MHVSPWLLASWCLGSLLSGELREEVMGDLCSSESAGMASK